MKITWLGQAGLLMENENITILIDPYLSDSVVKVNPRNYRRVPIDSSFFDVKPDVYICTHNHLDHLDPETLPIFLKPDRAVTVLCPEAAFDQTKMIGYPHNYIKFNRHCEWTEKGVRFTAVKAEHSDPHPIGVIIDDGDKKYYVTGDTLYNPDIFEDIPSDIFAVFLPINGLGNNMNITDAQRFAAKIGAKWVIPMHWGMFDELDPKQFHCDGRIIPELYKEIQFK